MTDSTISTSKRLLRILVGGSILAAAWVAFDALTHSESASAAEISEVAPSVSVSDPVADPVSGPVSDGVSPVVDRVAAHLAAIAAALPLEHVATVERVVADVVAVVITPPLAVIEPIVETMAEPLAPVLEPWVPVVDGVVGALPSIPRLSVIPGSGDLPTTRGSDLALTPSPIRAPVGGVPPDRPGLPAPSAPSTEQSAGSAAVLTSASLAPPGWVFSVAGVLAGIPSSPAFGFDTSPD